MKKLLAIMLTAAMMILLAPAQAENKTEDPYELFFTGTVFVGDSVTTQLKSYAREKKLFPGARFLCATNYRLNVASRAYTGSNSVELTLGGSPVTVQEGLQILKAKRVFILLGLNDHAGSNLEKDIERYTRIIDHIRDKLPDIEIIAQSVTPIQKHLQSKTLNQKNMNAFNEALAALCEEKGVYYLDIATPLMGEDGYLKTEYARDRKDNVHLNNKGLKVWADTLLAFADSYMAGELPPPADE